MSSIVAASDAWRKDESTQPVRSSGLADAADVHELWIVQVDSDDLVIQTAVIGHRNHADHTAASGASGSWQRASCTICVRPTVFVTSDSIT